MLPITNKKNYDKMLQKIISIRTFVKYFVMVHCHGGCPGQL